MKIILQYLFSFPKMEAANQLATCMEERCCTVPLVPTTPTSCSITTDHFGEDASPYTSIPGPSTS